MSPERAASSLGNTCTVSRPILPHSKSEDSLHYHGKINATFSYLILCMYSHPEISDFVKASFLIGYLLINK